VAVPVLVALVLVVLVVLVRSLDAGFVKEGFDVPARGAEGGHGIGMENLHPLDERGRLLPGEPVELNACLTGECEQCADSPGLALRGRGRFPGSANGCDGDGFNLWFPAAAFWR
jgi:hypothetical protein